jgi:hypothetical protein
MLKAAFVRTVGERDRIYVTRSDGTEVSWPFPTYGDGLPHDLVHLVVESAFGVRAGFWGRVDAGADPKAIADDANRRGGRDKYAAYGADRGELLVAEALVNAPWLTRGISNGAVLEAIGEACARDGLRPPAALTGNRVRETRALLGALGERWRTLVPKGVLDLEFQADDPEQGVARLKALVGLTTTAASPE